MAVNVEILYAKIFIEMYSCQQKNIVLCIEVLTHDRKKRDILENHSMDEESPFIESSYHKYLEDVME